jgi:D-tyrosyl-tRNA(Tyr) deacylase
LANQIALELILALIYYRAYNQVIHFSFYIPLAKISFYKMKVVIQRVNTASVTINAVVKSAIANGLLVLVGIEDADGDDDIIWLSNKIVNLRIFNDENDIPNISVKENGGDILLISQFTLQASTKKGNRPSYLKASKPDVAVLLYEKFILQVQQDLEKNISTGTFGADMKVALVNDGPVTIVIDSKHRE